MPAHARAQRPAARWSAMHDLLVRTCRLSRRPLSSSGTSARVPRVSGSLILNPGPLKRHLWLRLPMWLHLTTASNTKSPTEYTSSECARSSSPCARQRGGGQARWRTARAASARVRVCACACVCVLPSTVPAGKRSSPHQAWPFHTPTPAHTSPHSSERLHTPAGRTPPPGPPPTAGAPAGGPWCGPGLST